MKPAVIPGPAHTQFQPHSSLVPANPYLMEEIPPWLLVYVNGMLDLIGMVCSYFTS